MRHFAAACGLELEAFCRTPSGHFVLRQFAAVSIPRGFFF